jgi:SAM-dependent methyltransferase
MPLSRSAHDSTSRFILPTIAIYGQSAEKFLSRWGRRRYKRPPLLSQWLALLPARARLLDLGCGGGQDAKHLRESGYRVIGLDRTAALLSFARERSPGLPLVLADMRRLPLRAENMDGIWAAASLIHLPKTMLRTVLGDLRRLVRSQGILAATFTHGTKSRMVKRGWIPGRYFARWRKEELRRVFYRAGWEVLELAVVTGQERKGRWINVIARANR